MIFTQNLPQNLSIGYFPNFWLLIGWFWHNLIPLFRHQWIPCASDFLKVHLSLLDSGLSSILVWLYMLLKGPIIVFRFQIITIAKMMKIFDHLLFDYHSLFLRMQTVSLGIPYTSEGNFGRSRCSLCYSCQKFQILPLCKFPCWLSIHLAKILGLWCYLLQGMTFGRKLMGKIFCRILSSCINSFTNKRGHRSI